MKVPFSPPDITESDIALVAEVMRSGWITTGPKTKQFEGEIARFCGIEGVRRVVCLASATAAMELALRLLGVGPGDEVITSAYTYTASASVAEHVGARPVLVDTDPGSPAVSARYVEAAITERTKVVIPVDVAGVPADYAALGAAIERKKDIFSPGGELQRSLGRVAVVADCAHSFGARYGGAGVAMQGDFACFSFHAVKNLTTAEGGAVCFGDIGDVSADELYRRFMLYSLHGQNKDALAKAGSGAWEYDILMPGYKCNMTDIAAAMGLGQLRRYPDMQRRREEIVERYNRHFDDTAVRPLAHRGPDYTGSRHLYMVSVEGLDEAGRGRVIAGLAERGVSANVHYKPLPMMTAYKNMGYNIEDFPNAHAFYSSEITLPLHTLLTDEQIDYTADVLLTAIGKENAG